MSLMLDYFDAEYKYCQDVKIAPIIKNGLGFVVYWGILVWMYWVFPPAMQYLPPILGLITTFMYWKNATAITYKPYSKAFREWDFNSHWRVYTGNIDLLHGLEGNNYILFLNNHHKRTIGTVIMRMSASALHVRPNYHDVLRKLYLMQQKINLTFQIHTNKEGLPGMVYDLAITQSIGGSFNAIQWGELTTHLRRAVGNMFPVIQANFPHFNFTLLSGDELFRAMRTPFAIKQSPMIHTFRNEVSWLNYEKLVLLVVLFNMIGFGFHFWNYWWYFGFSEGIGFLFLIYLLSERATRIHFDHHFPGLFPLDLFHGCRILVQSSNGLIGLLDENRQNIQFQSYYTMSQFTFAFKLIQNKFYRAIASELHNTPFSLTLQYSLNRILPQGFNNYQSYFKSEFLTQFNESPQNQSALTRKVLGFYEWQPILSISYSVPVDSELLQSGDSKIEFITEMNEMMLRLFSPFFPNCELVSLNYKWCDLMGLTLTKSRHISIWGTRLPYFFAAGLYIEQFLHAPDELHKYIQTTYPAEFSTPTLSDEILFGTTYNPENATQEQAAGLLKNELDGNILFAGHDYLNFHRCTIRFVRELYREQYPLFIIDWDGTYSSLFRERDFDDLNPLYLLKIGENFGFQMFDLPLKPRGKTFSRYINQICNILQTYFHWSDKEMAVLLGELTELRNEPTEISFSSVIQKLASQDTEQKSPNTAVAAHLKLWSQDFYQECFNRGIDTYIPIMELFDDRTSFILDISDLQDPKLKLMAVQCILNQLLAILPDHSIFSRGIILPEIDLFVPQANATTHANSILFEPLRELHRAGFYFVFETKSMADVDLSILNFIQTYFMFREVDGKAIKRISDLLNFDTLYTNVYSKNSRKISYQESFLKSMPVDKSLVLRKIYMMPFVFQFDLDGKKDLIRRTTFGAKIATRSHNNDDLIVMYEGKGDIRIDTSAPRLSMLEDDFGGFGLPMDKLLFFMKELKKVANKTQALFENSIKQDIELLFLPIFTETKTERKCMVLIDRVFMKLLERNYIKANTVLVNNTDLPTYNITEKVEKAIGEYQLKCERLDCSNVGVSVEIDEIDSIESYLTDENNESILPNSALQERLADIIVEARVILDEGNKEGAKNIVENKLTSIITQRPEPLLVKFKERVVQNDDIKLVINEIENYCITQL